jgi:hypothetical protein
MSPVLSGNLRVALRALQSVAHGLVILLTLCLIAASSFAALGVLPWPRLSLGFGASELPNAGMWAQLGLTAFSALLCLFLPANARMARLERSHRTFAMGLEDVAHAYRIAHAADRAGVFALSAEFENMRARLNHLRQHPDLAHLEPELLQLAAAMSFQTRDLARTYSDARVSRARDFLRQRQEEVQALTDRITLARQTTDELRRWLTDIEAEERLAEQQIKRLEADLREILPQLGYALEVDDPRDATVVQLPKPAK